MIPLGLTASDKAAYERALTQSHTMRVRAFIHDRDERIVHEFSGSILSGEVQVDWTKSPSNLGFARGQGSSSSGPVRTLTLEILLPKNNGSWLPDAPGTEAVFADNFISVQRGIWVSELERWVDVPVFWGPITGLSNDGGRVTIKGEGKESLAIDPCVIWFALRINKGTLRTTAIRQLLEAMGERRFSWGHHTQRVTHKYSVPQGTSAWDLASSIAKHGNWQLFYDGLGRARVREFPANRVWTFREGGSLLSRPEIDYSLNEVRNTVVVNGTATKGKDRKLRSVVWFLSHHPLSDWSLRRNGVRRRMVHFEEGVTAPTGQGLQNIAERILRDSALAATTVTAETLVIPHLEEGDRVGVYVDGQLIEFNLTKFTIPLTSGGRMTIGVNRRVSWRGRSVKYGWGR